MEANLYQFTLKEFLSYKPLKISLGAFEIIEGDISQFNYVYVHSKSLLLTEIIKQACQGYGAVLFLDMNCSLDFELIQDNKVLRYKIFSACEFLMYLKSLYSFIKDAKFRALVIIDSWNDYFWGGDFREGMLNGLIEKKCWETVFKLNEKFFCTFVICKKTKPIKEDFGFEGYRFNFVRFDRKEKVKNFGLLDPQQEIGSSRLLHGLVDEDFTKICVFVHPFSWIAIEKIEICANSESSL